MLTLAFLGYPPNAAFVLGTPRGYFERHGFERLLNRNLSFFCSGRRNVISLATISV
jgi:hypothetical protein